LERLGEHAVASTRQVEQAQGPGRDSRGVAAVARSAWKKACAAFDQFEEADAGGKRAHSARQVSDPTAD
jgi:hypothetical protein